MLTSRENFPHYVADSLCLFLFLLKWDRCARKGLYTLYAISQQSSQGCPRNSVNVDVVEHRSYLTSEGGMSAASCLHSSFLQAISAVMLWPFHAQKVPQASKPLCPAKLQTRCDVYCASGSISVSACSFSLTRAVDPQKLLHLKILHSCVAVGAAHARLHLLQ